MTCNVTLEHPIIPLASRYIRASVLALLLMVSVSGNLTFIAMLTRSNARLCPTKSLQRILSVTALIFAIHNLTIQLIIVAAGGWLLGDTFCQVYGLCSHVLIGSWPWFVVLVVMERYISISSPSEHLAIFSPINLKLLVWGVVLLMLVVFLAPTYGWGEYSTMKGEVVVLLQPVSGHVYNSPVYNTDIQTRFYQHIMTHFDTAPVHLLRDRIYTYFTVTRGLRVRRLHMIIQGVLLSLRAENPERMLCLESDHQRGLLSHQISDYVTTNLTLSSIHLHNLTFNAHFDTKKLTLYSNVFSHFQEASMCSLDYSKVNRNIDSFIGFMLVVVIIIPCCCLLYLLCRLFWLLWCRNQATITRDQLRHNRTSLTTLTCTSLSTLVLYVPHFTLSIMAGQGHQISSAAHFSGLILLHGCTVIPWMPFFVIYHTNRVSVWYNRRFSSSPSRNGRALTNRDITKESSLCAEACAEDVTASEPSNTVF